MKYCKWCGETKETSEFYLRPKKKDDGLHNKCKACCKKQYSEYYGNNIDKIKAYEKERWQRPEVKERNNNHTKKTRHTNPEKFLARALVFRALRSGRITKQPCEICGGVKVQAHHDDYMKPLDINWLCRKHHLEKHNQIAWV